jgi:hypothetical protein
MPAIRHWEDETELLRVKPLNSETLYETTHSWNSKPQNIEQEISNDEVWHRCAQSFFKNNNDRIPYFDIRYSLFIVRYSLFAFSKFIFRLDQLFLAGDWAGA